MTDSVNQIRIMTYNVHKGIGGVDRRYRPERIVETIAHYNPDLALLQEVDAGVPRSRFHQQVEYFAEALGYTHWAFQANVKLRRGCYGNAILSRFAIAESTNIDLTVKFKKRRRALVVRCRVPVGDHTRTIYVANMHLGLADFERTIQIRRFLSNSLFEHVRHETPFIAAGDFNDTWGNLGRRLWQPNGFDPAVQKANTFPAILPVRPLDGIYVRGAAQIVAGYAGRLQLARQASDHLPIIAQIDCR